MLVAVEGRLLLKDGALLDAGGTARTGMSVLVADGRIVRVDQDEALPALPGDWAVRCRGRLIVPGRLDLNADPVGRLLGGATPAARESLAGRLGPSEVELLSLFGLGRAALYGATTQLASVRAPRCVEAALRAQAAAAQRLRVRLVHSHSSRTDGEWEANAAYARGDRMGHVVPFMGGRRSEGPTSAAESLRTARSLGLGLRLRLQDEDLAADFWTALKETNDSSPPTVLVWPRAVPPELARVADPSRTLVVREPEESSSGLERWAQASGRSALRAEGFESRRWLSALFGEEVGSIAPGALADLLVLDALPTGALDPEGTPELLGERVRPSWVVVGGEVVVREGQLLGLDLLGLGREVADLLTRLRDP